MKKSACILLLFGAAAWGPPGVGAMEFFKGDAFVTQKDEVRERQLWVAAVTGRLEGVARDDVFLFSRDAVLSGRFERDLWCAAETVYFDGSAGGHVRLAAARTVLVEGRSGRSLLAVGNALRVAPGAGAEEAVMLVGEHVIFEGDAGGELTLVAARAALGGRVGASARVLAREIVVLPGAVIEGDLVYSGPEELHLPRNASIAGSVRRESPAAADDAGPGFLTTLVPRAFRSLLFYAGALLSGWLWMLFFPRSAAGAASRLAAAPGRALLFGLAAFALPPFLILLLSATLFGLPSAGMLLLAYLLAVYLARIVSGLALGVFLLPRARGSGASSGVLAAGLLPLYILSLAPIIGPVLWLGATCMGLGGLVGHILADRRPPPPATPDGCEEEQFKWEQNAS